jgi:DNA-binding NarL/FixJ family response regulator
MGQRISVLVADDHSLVRAGFRSILSDEDDIDVVGEARDGAEAVEVATRERPDVVLMDIRMPGMDGLEATRRVTADPRLRGTRVVVLTTFDLDEYIFGALKAGASAFLLKGVEPQALIAAVRTVAAGDALLEPSAARRLIEAYVNGQQAAAQEPPAGFPLPSSLTPREEEVLRLIAAGWTNNEIAEHLFISPLTCKSHVSRILMKLEARDRIQLVVIAYETGLVTPGQPSGPPGPPRAGQLRAFGHVRGSAPQVTDLTDQNPAYRPTLG